ncbi:hypothetical protein ACF0H5_019758 [Mactra antiquata]
MGRISIARALSVRLMFASHGVISIWRLTDVTRDARYWYLAGTLSLLVIECSVAILKRQGKEWKWFCPSVFIYLLISVPAIWFLELHEFDRRITYHQNILQLARTNNKTIQLNANLPAKQEDLSAYIGSVLGIRFEVRIPIKLTPDEWITMLEQLLLLVLIVGRWLLPKGKLTHNQLSQLLLVYIGTAADIVEFFEAFKENEVRYRKILCIIILGIWSLSLVQFTLVLTASRARRDQSGIYLANTEKGNKNVCCNGDVFGILISILLQDLPFLVLRMMLIFKYNVLSYTNMFFTSKNSLVIALLAYRLVALFLNRNGLVKEVSIDTIYSEVSEIPEKSVFRRTSEIRRKLLTYHELDLLYQRQSCLLPRDLYANYGEIKWNRRCESMHA